MVSGCICLAEMVRPIDWTEQWSRVAANGSKPAIDKRARGRRQVRKTSGAVGIAF